MEFFQRKRRALRQKIKNIKADLDKVFFIVVFLTNVCSSIYFYIQLILLLLCEYNSITLYYSELCMGSFLGAITSGICSCYSFCNNFFSQDFLQSRFWKIFLKLRFERFKLSAAETIKNFSYFGLFSDYFLCFFLLFFFLCSLLQNTTITLHIALFFAAGCCHWN